MTANTLPPPKPGPSWRIMPLVLTDGMTGIQSIVGSWEGLKLIKARGISSQKVSLCYISNRSLREGGRGDELVCKDLGKNSMKNHIS